MYAVLMSSPIWRTYTTGRTDDFFVGENHFLLELMPHPRVLFCPSKETKYIDIVDHRLPGRLSFGTRQGAVDRPSSGLDIEFDAINATLSNDESTSAYVEIQPGPNAVSIKDIQQTWKSTMQIQKLEVYELEGGVTVGLSVNRMAESSSSPKDLPCSNE